MQYLKTQDLMERYKVSRQAIEQWRIGGLPHEKFGPKTIRYDGDKVERWLINKSSQRAGKESE